MWIALLEKLKFNKLKIEKMKKLSLILIAVLFILSSCKKEDINQIEQKTTVANEKLISVRNTKEQERNWKPFACEYVFDDKSVVPGAGCTSSLYPTDACKKFIPCTPICPQMINEHFSLEEINRWKNGEDIFIESSRYYIEHYEFFIYLNSLGICNHPDIIINNLKKLGL